MCNSVSCSHNGRDNLDDDISDFFGGASDDVFGDGRLSADELAAGVRLATEAAQYKMHKETCKGCGGRGRFISWAGRDCGPCFKCKGKGYQMFRTSLAQREKAKASAAVRRDRKAQEIAAAAQAWREANPAEAAWIADAAGRGFDFAVAMRDALAKYGTLTERQHAACTNAAAKSAAKKAEWAARDAARVENAPAIDVSAIEAAFDVARGNGLKRLSLRLDGFKFKPAGANSKNAGSIYVTDLHETDAYGEAKYLGKITAGKFFASRACVAEVEARIIAVASNPAEAAVAYGNMTGSCAICGRHLENAESVARGIGPICAAKYGF